MSMAKNRIFSVLVLVGVLSLIVVIPFLIFGEEMEGFVSGVLENNSKGPFSFGVIVVILLASDVILPVPSSILSSWSGYYFGFVQGWMISSLGMTVGCICGYCLGTYGRCLVGDKQKAMCESVADKYGYWAIAILRGVPVLAEVSVVFFGIGKYSIRRFLAVSTLANLGISGVYSYAGYISNTNNSFIYAIAAATLLPLSFHVIYKLS